MGFLDMFRKKEPPSQQLDYRLGDDNGQPIPARLALTGGFELPINPSSGLTDPLYYPTGNYLVGISMRSAKMAMITEDVTPNVYESYPIKPETARRYTVLPTPLYNNNAVRVFDDL